MKKVDLVIYRPSFGTFLKYFLLLLSLLFLYRDVIGKLILTWMHDPDYSHGFIVPLISGYLIWKKKAELTSAVRQPHWSGFLLFLGGLFFLAAGTVGAENFISRVSLVLAILGLILALGGRESFQLLFIPVSFLLLMIPPPAIIMNSVTFPLQIWASKLAYQMLLLFQVPVIREGNLIVLPNITLEVVEACSGIRSLVSLITLSLIFTYFLHFSAIVRIFFILSVIPIAVISNAMRVAGTGLLAYFSNPDLSQGFFHEFSGLAVFLVALLLLLGEAWLITSFLKRKRLNPSGP